MPSEGPNNAALCVNDTTVGTKPWSPVVNAQGAINGVFATTGAAPGTIQSNYLKATGFGFTIPAGSIPDGIQVCAQRRRMGANCTDSFINIVKGGVIGATNRSAGALWASPVALECFGGPTDLWGETWTDADINSPIFGTAFAPQIVNFTSGQIDAFLLTVFFTAPTGVPGTASMMQLVG